MAKITLRKRDIDALPIPKTYPVTYWDTKMRRFGLRITPQGIRTFVLDYTTKAGKQRRISLGRFGEITADEARALAGDKLAEIRKGSDPLADRENARGAASFKALAETYILDHCPEKKSGKEDERIIRVELLPKWGRRLASDIARRDVIALTQEIKRRGSPIMSNRTVSLISRLFNFGIDRELVENNPATRVRPPAKEKSRERVLSNEEIKALWRGLDKVPCDPGTRFALQLVLVVAQRPGEICSMQWEEIDSESVWSIPGEKVKSGRSHRVPLSPLALEILSSIPRRGVGPVFPSPRDPQKSISREALARAVNRGRKFLELDPFTPHDLRRTAASKMAEMGVSRFILSRILNHADREITSVYDRHGYDAEKRTALEAWGEKLRGIIEERETKIVPLARA